MYIFLINNLYMVQNLRPKAWVWPHTPFRFTQIGGNQVLAASITKIFISYFFQQTHSHTRTPNFIICMFFWLVAHNMFHYWSGTDFSVCCAQVRQQQVQQLVQGHHRHGFPHQGGPDWRPPLHIAGLLPACLQCVRFIFRRSILLIGRFSFIMSS